MEKPDFNQIAASIYYKNHELDTDTILIIAMDHVWDTHVVPIQEDNKQLMSDQDILANDLKNTLEREEALIESVNELESENKLLREEMERLKAELNSKCNNMM